MVLLGLQCNDLVLERIRYLQLQLTKAQRIAKQSNLLALLITALLQQQQTRAQLGIPPLCSFIVLQFACGYSTENLMCFAQARCSVTTFSSSPWCQFGYLLRLLHFPTVSSWKQFLESLWIDVLWACYSCVKNDLTKKAAFCFDPETCTVFYLFTCVIPAVCSHLAQPIHAQFKPQSVLQTLIQPLQTKLQISQRQGEKMPQEAGQMQF